MTYKGSAEVLAQENAQLRAELSRLQSVEQKYDELKRAARTLLECHTQYNDEGWWRPMPSKTFAERDAALDNLASLLDGEK